MRVKVENTTYERDINSMALLETNEDKSNAYLSAREMMRKQRQQEQEINTLKTEINSMGNTLNLILEELRKK